MLIFDIFEPWLLYYKASWTNSVDPDQTAPKGVVLSGSTMFASMLM